MANVALADAIAADADRISVTGRDADVPLSEKGEHQARAAGRWFGALAPDARPERVVCSPYRRARETAKIIVEEAGLDLPLTLDERLREKDLGSFEKLTHKGIEHGDAGQAALQHEIGKFYYRAPGEKAGAT